MLSLSNSSLLACRKATDMFINLVPVTLLNSCICSNCFIIETLRFCVYSIMPSGNSDSFTSSHLSWMLFVCLSLLVAVARTSNTVLNRSDENEHPCLIIDFKGKTFNFSPLRMMLAMDFS